MSARKKTPANAAGARAVGGPSLDGPVRMAAAALDDREVRGAKLADAATRAKARVAVLDADTAIYWGSNHSSRAYQVIREIRNDRGTLTIAYRCTCFDFKKQGRIDCLHVFADRIRRKEVVVVGDLPGHRVARATSPRRPPRKQLTADGRSHRTAQRAARKNMAPRIRELVPMLAVEYDRHQPSSASRKRGGQAYPPRSVQRCFCTRS